MIRRPSKYPKIGDLKLIPEGKFNSSLSYEENSFSNLVFVDSFHIDYYPITNKQFSEFINEVKSWSKLSSIRVEKNMYYLMDWRDNEFPFDKQDHPVTWVSWFAAAAFCNWRSIKEDLTLCYNIDNNYDCDYNASGYRLPTNFEFEKVLRGGLINKKYPFGDDLFHTQANFDNSIGQTSYVGLFPANPFGLFDIVGNIKEWCNDWFSLDIIKKFYMDSDISVLSKKTDEVFKIVRGGSWNSKKEELLCSSIRILQPENTNPDFGFRCVRKT